MSNELPSQASSGSAVRRWDARVLVFPRQEILDPQGNAIGAALGRLGFDCVDSVRAGKSFEIELQAENEECARIQVQRMCESLLSNPIIEDYAVLIEDSA